MNDEFPKKRHLGDIFNEDEIKSLFKKYLIFMATLEVFIFVVCFVYQLGIKEFDRFGTVSIPFPWKEYFLLSFIVPISITFILAMVIIGVNRYIFGHGIANDAILFPNYKDGKWRYVLARLNRMSYLMALILTIAIALLIYQIDTISYWFSKISFNSFNLFLICIILIFISLTILGIFWMSLQYKLAKQKMEFHYKKEALKYLEIIIKNENGDTPKKITKWIENHIK
ncbi:MAG: hypothetical protein HQK77_11400 [Desulfobacterales bacterium]|nr:hypothetical protein [Desulfobacterales bacterium]